MNRKYRTNITNVDWFNLGFRLLLIEKNFCLHLCEILHHIWYYLTYQHICCQHSRLWVLWRALSFSAHLLTLTVWGTVANLTSDQCQWGTSTLDTVYTLHTPILSASCSLSNQSGGWTANVQSWLHTEASNKVCSLLWYYSATQGALYTGTMFCDNTATLTLFMC